MGVFKKLKGDDVRINPIRVVFPGGTSNNEKLTANNQNRTGKNRSSDFDYDTTGTDNTALVYNSIRQLFYGAFFTQNFTRTGSSFEAGVDGTLTDKPQGEFSRFNPSFQGSLAYQRELSTSYNASVEVWSIPTKNFGESMVPGTVEVDGLKDDLSGNIYNGSSLQGNVFYDQGIIVWKGPASTNVEFSGSYTIYQSQYKCTAGPDEFNLSMNPSLLDDSLTDYDLDIVDSPEFMPFVTTIGLYNDNQDLVAVAKLSNPVQLNPYCDTNFIVRIDL